MNTAAIHHQPESEFAYLYTADKMHIRLRTGRSDIKSVALINGDPYQLEHSEWFKSTSQMEKYLSTSTHDYWTIETSAPHRRLSYAFKIEGMDGTVLFYGDHGFFPYQEATLKMANNYFKLPYFHEADRFKAPQWVKETVWYQIFPERFANGDPTNDPKGTLPWNSKEHPGRDDFFGGDLQGVLDHLDHLVDLGINGIYFCPIFQAASNHKYDTIDYFEIDSAFGDKKLFKKLVKECHKRGIRIMLDAVFNHMGDFAPQWQDVVKNGADSPYAKWFHIHKFPVSYTPTANFEFSNDITYDTFAFTPHMPKLNTANKDVQDYLLEIARYWIDEFDIDAWRLDVANEVDHRFWRKFHDVCTEAKPDIYILGEIWHSSQAWLHGDEFHGVMNYAFTDAILSYFVYQTIPLSKLVSELNHQLMLYREQTNQIMFNVLDSHDTPRLLTVAKNNKELMKQVLAFTFLQKGVPCLYYGDEYAMDGAGDPDCRKCMIWDPDKQDQDMYEFFKTLIAFRKEHQPLLSEGKLRWHEVDEQTGIIDFAYEYEGKMLRSIFNTGQLPVYIEKEQVLFSIQTQSLDETTIELAPYGFVVSIETAERIRHNDTTQNKHSLVAGSRRLSSLSKELSR
ncbi:glycoside hydrolase family 13 protein [Enterococcus quebecensis]|uniref:Alpha-glycosidase n=1 Tax=Enterococcus quebecensis TaxID=903983 RepID=A0A1E5GRN7_9ENTE|nr:glycoside hydrolase family 13 protein [Enterococcus quebecensis]OEG15225.1 alpha-glycosidase [Enterococcus quebecensis]OJG74806.1 neopullulanase [Enterococcus quebecensis]